MKLCPDCNKEILPYLKTGELKRIINNKITLTQLHFCVNCRTVFHEEHESFIFKPLIYKEKKDGNSKGRKSTDKRGNS